MANLDIQMPGGDPGLPDQPQVRMLVMAWNAQMGAMFANGGPVSTKGSLMCKYGVNLKIDRQDDCGKMQEALSAFATELSKGTANPDKRRPLRGDHGRRQRHLPQSGRTTS